jgi:anti-sigma factor RsiW
MLQVYVDGECDATTAREVAAHLEVCEPCDCEAATYRWLKSALRRQRVDDPEAVGRLCAFAALLTRRCPG